MHAERTKHKLFPLNRNTPWRWRRSFAGHQYTIDLPVGLPIAMGIGYLGGLLGFAGGVIKIPMMVLLFGVPIKVAIATSSLMVTITSTVGCIGHGYAGDFDPTLSIALAIAAAAGAQSLAYGRDLGFALCDLVLSADRKRRRGDDQRCCRQCSAL